MCERRDLDYRTNGSLPGWIGRSLWGVDYTQRRRISHGSEPVCAHDPDQLSEQ